MIGTVVDVVRNDPNTQYFIEGEDGRVYFGQIGDLTDLPKVTRGMEVEFDPRETVSKNKKPRATQIRLTTYASEIKAIYANKKPKPWHFAKSDPPKKSKWVWAKDEGLTKITPAYYFSKLNAWLRFEGETPTDRPPYIWRTMKFSDEFAGEVDIPWAKAARDELE